MNTKSFLELVLGHEGHYCVWANRTATGEAPEIKQKFYSSVTELVDAAEEFDHNGWNAFFALATYEESGSRKADNVKWMKSFFLDLDCGPNKEFDTQRAALQELQAFCKEHKLPRPTIINSGRGLHVYWILSRAISRDEWWPVAERLKKLCEDSGFEADPSVTSDAARILRVPNTHNYKYDPPLDVAFFGISPPVPVAFEVFSDLVGDAPIPVPKRYEPSALSAFKDAMYQNQKGSFQRLLDKNANGTGCVQIDYIIENQDTVPHDLWRAGLSIANVCEDGDMGAELMSSQHDDYNLAATLRKMQDTGGPQYCSTFERLNPTGCEGCPNNGKVSTPAMLTKEIAEATAEDNILEEAFGDTTKMVEIPTFPRPYFRGQNGGVYLRGTNADGDPEEVCVYHYDFYVTRRLQDVELGEVIAFALHLPRDGVREFIVPLSSVTAREEFRRHMSMQGITTFGKDIDKLMSYTAAWINELQQTTKASEAHQQFGWVDDNKLDAFVLGDKLITADSIEYNPPSAKTAGYIERLTPKGTQEGSKEVLDWYDRDGMELQQFTVCAGFGSVLMPFTGLYSLGVHLFGKTGAGKTTAIYAATSIWGDPRGLIGTGGDTPNSKMNQAELYHSIPMNTDEMTNFTPRQSSQYSYQLSEGVQKNRMAGGGNYERVRGKPWRLLAFSTGNTSMYAQMAMFKGDTKAEMQRLLELRTDEMPRLKISTKEGDKQLLNVQNNYGHFGPIFVQYVMNNKEAVLARYKVIKEKLDKRAGLDSVNRFWSGGCAAILTGASIAKEVGIIDYDLKKLYHWVASILIKVKNFVDDSTASVQTLVTGYMTENWSNILKIKSTQTSAGQDGVASMVIPEQNPRNTFVARFEPDTQMLFIVQNHFQKWLGEQRIDHVSTVQGMIEQMGATKIKKRLGKGTNFNLPPIWTIAVKLDGVSGVPETSED